MSEYDLAAIEADLRKLHAAASGLDGWSRESALEYVDVGEEELALDTIAYAFVANGKSLPVELVPVFRRLADTVYVHRDNPEFSTMARLLERTNHA